jgi:hypothetical protein
MIKMSDICKICGEQHPCKQCIHEIGPDRKEKPTCQNCGEELTEENYDDDGSEICIDCRESD